MAYTDHFDCFEDFDMREMGDFGGHDSFSINFYTGNGS